MLSGSAARQGSVCMRPRSGPIRAQNGTDS
jgi:hypothetical protein